MTVSMTYDFFGAFDADGPTAPHSPLTAYDGIPVDGFNSDAAMTKLTGLGIPADKLLLGIGFYGRGWTGVSQSEPGGSASGPAPGRYEQGIEDYKVLKGRCPSTGTVGGTSYSHCGSEWWSFDLRRRSPARWRTCRSAVWAARSSGSSAVTPPTAS
jgi:chitinase